MFCATFLNYIPLAALAAILIRVGFKLNKISIYKKVIAGGAGQYITFLSTSSIPLACEGGLAFELVVKRFPMMNAIELTSEHNKAEFANITFMFDDDITITLENNRLCSGITCYFGDTWEIEKLWEWLGQKELKALEINPKQKNSAR